MPASRTIHPLRLAPSIARCFNSAVLVPVYVVVVGDGGDSSKTWRIIWCDVDVCKEIACPLTKSGQCISVVSSLDSYSHWLNALLALFPGIVLSLPFGLSFDKGRGFLCWAVMHPTFG